MSSISFKPLTHRDTASLPKRWPSTKQPLLSLLPYSLNKQGRHYRYRLVWVFCDLEVCNQKHKLCNRTDYLLLLGWYYVSHILLMLWRQLWYSVYVYNCLINLSVGTSYACIPVCRIRRQAVTGRTFYTFSGLVLVAWVVLYLVCVQNRTCNIPYFAMVVFCTAHRKLLFVGHSQTTSK